MESAAAAFEARYGYAPTGVWSAPGRVNLIGEHTDYNLGFVLPFAINRRTYAAISLRQDQTVRVMSSFSDEQHQIELADISKNAANDWAAYPFGVAWALAKLGQTAGVGFDAYFESDVPVGSGLSSSAAIECSTSLALNELWQTNLSRPELARVGQLAENEIVGAPTGIMDQSASLLGERDHAVFLDCKSLEAQSIELGFDDEGLELLIIDTRVTHRLNDGGYATRRAACELGASQMGATSLREVSVDQLGKAKEIMDDVTFRRVRHIVTENERVLETVEKLRTEGPKSIGALLNASHVSMRDDFEISIDELDTAVDVAVRHGAVGARMTGGGFGGAAIALAPIAKVSEITLAVFAEFELLGYGKPNIFAVTADQGARRDR
ncbi:MAG: galactokinase [Rhodoluna sp.]|nr:galactokinase [Rhodoluna sp.]